MDWGPMHAPNSEIRRDEINARADCPLFQAANHWLVQYLSREFQVEVDKALRDSAAPRPAGRKLNVPSGKTFPTICGCDLGNLQQQLLRRRLDETCLRGN
jgi:hypothetical protein